MGHFGASGEGMPQDHGGDRWASGVAQMRARLPRIVFAAALAGVLAGGGISVARAADDGSNDDTLLAKVLQKLGLQAPPDQSPDISYSERSPLVVPPSRDLPPPVAEAPPGADWPKDAAKPRKHVRSKSQPPAPAAVATVPAAPADGGAAAGQSAPAPQGGQAAAPGPAGQAPPPQSGQAAAPAQTGSVARVPNPTPQSSSWWNPKSWFSREEYATFATEPAREDLTDPPAGYRTPSPDQPYGVGPERKKKNAEQPWTPTVTTKDLPH
jgi:hypothetical protein